MAKFYSIMQHPLSSEQRAEIVPLGLVDIVELNVVRKGDFNQLLDVPADPDLGREWFVERAQVIAEALGGFDSADVVLAMGQPQLAAAIQAEARNAGAFVVEAVSERRSVEQTQPDGSTRKVAVFVHRGFRPVYAY